MAMPTRAERIRFHFTKNPTATNKEVVEAVKCSSRMVSYVRAQMVKEGILQPAWGDHKSSTRKKEGVSSIEKVGKAAEGTPFAVENTADLNEAIARATRDAREADHDSDEIDLQVLKRILWKIARTDPDNRIRTQAIWTLTRVQQEVSERALGPGNPMTEEGAIDRLLLLFKGVGPETVIKALNTYMAQLKGATHAAPTSVEQENAPQASVETPPVAKDETDVRPDGGIRSDG